MFKIKKKGFFIVTLVFLILLFNPSHAASTVTITQNQILIPGALYTDQLALRNIKSDSAYTIVLDANDSVRFWIMSESEYDAWQGTPDYDPVCVVNVSSTYWTASGAIFGSDGDYYYGLKNEGSNTINVTVTITKPTSINGFTSISVLLGLLFIAGIFYLSKKKSPNFANLP